jgi:hypothetical protein
VATVVKRSKKCCKIKWFDLFSERPRYTDNCFSQSKVCDASIVVLTEQKIETEIALMRMLREFNLLVIVVNLTVKLF